MRSSIEKVGCYHCSGTRLSNRRTQALNFGGGLSDIRVLLLENGSAPLVHPMITAKRLAEGHSGDDLTFSVATSDSEEPPLTYEWSFGME